MSQSLGSKHIKHTKCGEVAVLAVEKKQINGDLLARTFQGQALIKIRRWSQILDVFR